MKTYRIIKFDKHYYLVMRYCGRTQNNVYCKTKRELNEKIGELKSAGYIESEE